MAGTARFLPIVLTLFGAVLPSFGHIYLEPMITTYLPFSLDPKPQFGFDKEATEQIALDLEHNVLFAVGNNNIFVLDISDPEKQRVITKLSIESNFKFEDVEVCGDYIYTTVFITDDMFKGFVKLFTYDVKSQTLALFTTIKVGAQPDSLAITKNCSTILVTLEGQAFVDKSDHIIDPEGGIGVIRWNPQKPEDGAKYTEIDFKKFNSRQCELMAAGVRFVYKENGTTFSQDVEPEGVTLNADETRAYITLQENNAVAVLNISDADHPAIIDIHGLGTKSFRESELDPSMADGGIQLNRWLIEGYLQPDGIKAFTHRGIEYFVIANEGSPKFYQGSKGVLFKEVKSGAMIVSDNEVDETVPQSLKAALADKTKLGEMRFSTQSGKNPVTGKFKKFFIFGGRSFSLIRTSDMAMVYESGSSLGRSIARSYPAFFNSKPQGDKTPGALFENQSPIGGNDPETVEVGKGFGKTLLFIGNEHPGTISIYSMGGSRPTPHFESVYFGAEARPGEFWSDIYEGRRTRDLDPEDLIFVPASKSVTGRPLLFAVGTVSGTVTCYSVKYMGQKPHRGANRLGNKRRQRPEHMRPHRPEHMRPHNPEHMRPHRPEHRRPHRPEHRRPHRPEHMRPHRPDHIRPHRPEHRGRQRPEQRRSQRLERMRPQRPGQRRPQGPEDNKTQNPEQKKPQRSEQGRPQRTGRTRPEQGTTQKPEQRRPQGPEQRRPQRPKQRKSKPSSKGSKSDKYYKGQISQKNTTAP